MMNEDQKHIPFAYVYLDDLFMFTKDSANLTEHFITILERISLDELC